MATVEAPEKQAAVEKAAQEFETEVWRLYALARQQPPYSDSDKGGDAVQ